MRLEIEDPAETARLKLMIVDEAWRYMQDPAVLNYLAEAAKTWRKKNAALVLATQSAVDVTGTPSASAFLESIPTKLLLANAELPTEAGAPDRRPAGGRAVRAPGGLPMSRWKQWVKEPKGALPGGPSSRRPGSS